MLFSANKFKQAAALTACCVLYFVFSVATSKYVPKSYCTAKVDSVLGRDGSIYNYQNQYYPEDTLYIFSEKDSAWPARTSVLCKIYKDSCPTIFPRILVLNNRLPSSNWDHKLGKKIYFVQCP